MTGKFVFAVTAAALGSGFQHGFHMGFVNIPSLMFVEYIKNNTDYYSDETYKTYHAVVMWAITIASFAIGGFLGGILVIVAGGTGRKPILLLSNVIVLIGGLLQCLTYVARTFDVFIAGRFIIGIHAGLNSGICPIYLVEIAPDHLRGVAGSSYNVVVSFGIFFSQILSLPEVLGTFESWPIAIAISIIPSVLQIVCLIFVPESPRFLYITNEEEDDADESLTWLRNSWDVDDELDEIREEANVLEDIGAVSFGRLLSDQTLRSPLIICTVIMLGHQFCGANAIFFYSNFLLTEVGFRAAASYITLGLGATNFVMTLISMFLADVCGRKPLILVSFIGMTFATVSLTVTLELLRKNVELQKPLANSVVISMYFFIFLFALGAGSIPWFVTPELNNYSARIPATSIVVTIGWLMQFIFAATFLLIYKGITYYIFLFHFAANLIAFLFLAFTMRETMDMTDLDIIELFYD